MPDLDKLSRPLRRVLAEWLSRLVERLLHFQYQLRYGLIRMISTSVAETIEDQLHRPFTNPPPLSHYEEDYGEYEELPSTPRLAYTSPSESRNQPHAATSTDGWRGILSRAAHIFVQWLRQPWVEPLAAGCVTLISLLLLVR